MTPLGVAVVTTLEEHLAAAEPLLRQWGQAAVFGCIFAEGVGIPAPGQTLLVAAAVLAGRGEFALVPLLALAVVAAALGNALGWLIGRKGGRPLLQRFAHGERLARVERLFARWGPRVVALGRFVDGLRQINGLAAGALGMERAPFLVWNAIGALLWVGFWGLGAYGFGRDFNAIASAIHRIGPALGLLVLVGAALLLIYLLLAPRRKA
ncbi:MAG TPA: alkaline phosphatase [Deltaproteobacteria bacterium]|jgi:membrane protein DedA with SNARE-associated domain|nr:alkaline phosphatase [Deltaproteobacteria bacterium]